MTIPASSHPELAFDKTSQLHETKGLTPAQQAVKLKLARESALMREQYACRACGIGGHLLRHEEPPRSHGGWRQLCARGDVDEIRQRLVMVCGTCHDQRHPGPGSLVKLYMQILDGRLGTDGVIRFTRVNLDTGEQDVWDSTPRYPVWAAPSAEIRAS